MDGGSNGGMGGGGCRGEAQPSDPKEAGAGGALLESLPVVRLALANAAVARLVGAGLVAVVGISVPDDFPQWTGPNDLQAVGLRKNDDKRLGASPLGDEGAGGGEPVSDGASAMGTING